MNLKQKTINKDQNCGHSVQFYKTENHLVNQVSEFIIEGLTAGRAAIIIATQEHIDDIEKNLKLSLGRPKLGSLESCVFIDAEKTLARFMSAGWPDEIAFNKVMDGLLGGVQSDRAKPIHAYGEMVALLCEQGKPDAAIRLEELWNQLAGRYSFSLLCGYPMEAFSKEENSQSFHAICNLHSHVFPVETHEIPLAPKDGALTLARLQQKTLALESEILRRQKIEETLKQNERMLMERTLALEAANANLRSEIVKRTASEKNLLHVKHVHDVSQSIAHVGCWEIDTTTGIMECSDEFFRICGLEPQSIEFTLEYAQRIVHPDDREAAWDAIITAKESKGNYCIEKRIIRPDGSIRYVVSQGQAILNQQQELTGFIGSYLDVTEHRFVERELSKSEERFRSLVSLSSDWYWEQNEELRFTTLSETGLHKLDIDASALIGLKTWELPGAYVAEPVASVHKADLAARRAFHDLELSMLSSKDERVHLQISGEPMFDAAGKFTGYRGVGKDVTERKQTQEALRQSHDDLRRLAAHQEKIKEEERKRIARELHDELGGLLTGLKAYVGVSMQRAERAGLPPDDLLVEASHITDIALDSVRRIITDLRPSVLDQLGVWAALDWYAGQVAERADLVCTYTMDQAVAAISLDPERSTVLFRSMQEALTNVVKHASASEIAISVRIQDDFISVEVKDNGKGIDVEGLLNRESWGISGMYERIRHFGGELKINGVCGEGTTVQLLLPLEGSYV